MITRLKKLIILSGLIGLVNYTLAQTNVFPASGSVGIGTTTPTYKLDVYAPEGQWKSRFQGPDGYITIGPVNSSWAHIYTDRPNFIFNQGIWSIPGTFSSHSSSDLSLQTNGTSRLTIINSSGNVGIGSTTPEAKFTISQIGNGWNDGLRINRDANNYLTLTEDVTDIRLKNWGTGGIKFFTSTIEAFTILNNGKVGVGTSSPVYKFEVNSSSSASARIISNASSSSNPALDIYDQTNGTEFVMSPSVGKFDLFTWSNHPLALGTHNTEHVRILTNGKIGIGTSNPDEKLTVKGKVHAEEVIIDLSVPAPDYVFEKSYDLKSLDEVKKYIDENKHLPEVPSAREMEKDGVKVGEMEMILLKKIEELTLYVVELKKENEKQSEEIEKLKADRKN